MSGGSDQSASRLCLEAKSGQILLSQRAYAKVENGVVAEPVEERTLKGLDRAIPTYNVAGLREGG